MRTQTIPVMTLPENHSATPLQKLMDALSDGWRVQSPVYFRKQWYTGQGTRDGYYFILKKEQETDLIIVPADDRARQLIELQRLKVIAA